jgi:hypothetical protein
MPATASWATQVVEYYKQGYSDTEVAAALNMTKREFNQMLTQEPTFLKIVDFGRTLSAAYWEGLARTNVKNKTFNTPLYNFYMKNKFGWADKIETTNANENTNYSLDELKVMVRDKVKKLVDNNTLSDVDAKKVLEPIIVKDDAEDE